MSMIFKKYYLILAISILLISLFSCRKDNVPSPRFDQDELLLNDVDSSNDKDADGGDKGGSEIVGGDDDEDDDGGVSDGDGDRDGSDIKGGSGSGDPSVDSGASSKEG